MKYEIAVCDDDARDAEYAARLAAVWAEQNGVSADIREFSSSENFLFECGAGNPFDILLLDVEMRSMNGIELAKRIRCSDRRAEIIFISSHSEFLGEGYEVDALHYLIKPVNSAKLSEVLSRAASRLSAEPPSVIISCDGETVRLPEDKILFVEAFSHYITIHTTDGDFKIKENISVFESKLSGDFFRVHRSYIASLRAVARISRNSVTLRNGEVLPLSRGLYDAVNRAFIDRN